MRKSLTFRTTKCHRLSPSTGLDFRSLGSCLVQTKDRAVVTGGGARGEAASPGHVKPDKLSQWMDL